jgi:DNA (cytosine-5)-methyltransferase 1
MWARATATYAANFPDTHVVTDRLENIDLASLRRRVGKIDLLMASPECTSHTCAKGSAPRSEASKATAMQAVRFAEAFKPRWIVLENVIHMRPWSRYAAFTSQLARLGYKVAEQVIEASDHGVPQARKRLFIVADRERQPYLVTSKRSGRKPSASSVLDPHGTWKTSPLFRDKRAAATLERAQRGFDALGEDARFLVVYYGSDGAGGWQGLDRPLRTITTVDRFALIEPGTDGPTMRMLQVSELKRAMGLPESFKMPVGSRRERIHMLGNGVCPPVMEAVVRAVTAD